MLPCLDIFSIGIAAGMCVHLLFEKCWKLKLKLQYGYIWLHMALTGVHLGTNVGLRDWLVDWCQSK